MRYLTAVLLVLLGSVATAQDHSIPFLFGVPSAIMPTHGAISMQWGVAVVTENSTADIACVASCTVTIDLPAGTYLWRHVRKTAGGLVLGTGSGSSLTVDDSGPTAAVKALLLESGDDLLLESGDKIKLEAGAQ